MREPNLDDVHLALRLYELRREKEMRKARNFALMFTPQSLDELLAVVAWEHPENAHFRQVTSYWEMVSDFALRGLYHPEIYAAHAGEALVIFVRLSQFIPAMRERGFTRFLANTEACVAKYPAVAAKVDGLRAMLAARAAMTKSAAAKPATKTQVSSPVNSPSKKAPKKSAPRRSKTSR